MKNNMKSVRMTNEVMAAVEGYKGNGFNEKFENLVNDFIHGREKMQREIELMYAQIADKRMEMRSVQQRCQRMREVEPRLTALVNSVVALMEVK